MSKDPWYHEFRQTKRLVFSVSQDCIYLPLDRLPAQGTPSRSHHLRQVLPLLPARIGGYNVFVLGRIGDFIRRQDRLPAAWWHGCICLQLSIKQEFVEATFDNVWLKTWQAAVPNGSREVLNLGYHFPNSQSRRENIMLVPRESHGGLIDICLARKHIHTPIFI